MRILFVIEDLGPGGAQRQIVNLAMDFKEKGHDVSFVTYYPKPFYIGFLQQSGIHIESFIGKSPFFRVISIRNYIRKGDFDGVIAFLGTPAFICELAAMPYHRWKLIVGERSANPNLKQKFKLRFKRYFHFFADYVVSNSYTNMEMVRSINPLLPDRICKVIYNSFDLDVYKPINDFKFCINGKLNILIPASYRKLKNLIGLIKAVDRLDPDEKQQLEIHWYGDRTPKAEPDFILEEAEELIRTSGLRDVFTLHNSEFEIHKIIQQADAVGLFSFFEGLPNALCEGMACGKPIIASDVSDVPLLVEDKVNGVLCKATDIESITRALRYMLSLSPAELEAMGKKGRLKAEELFDGRVNSEKYLELLG